MYGVLAICGGWVGPCYFRANMHTLPQTPAELEAFLSKFESAHYSEACIMSPQARAQWIEPDLRPLESADVSSRSGRSSTPGAGS